MTLKTKFIFLKYNLILLKLQQLLLFYSSLSSIFVLIAKIDDESLSY